MVGSAVACLLVLITALSPQAQPAAQADGELWTAAVEQVQRDLQVQHSVDQLRGSMSHKALPDSMAFVRGNYIRILESYKPA